MDYILYCTALCYCPYCILYHFTGARVLSFKQPLLSLRVDIGTRALSFKWCLLSLSVEFCLLVRERSALSDPYCQPTWMSVCLPVCLCVCPQLWGQISRKPKELEGKLIWRAYRKVARGYRMVTSPMTSRDPVTSHLSIKMLLLPQFLSELDHIVT